jgi:uncharacterized membrane protein
MSAPTALGLWLLPVPGERRVITVAGAVAGLCLAVVAIAAAAAWNTEARTATVALIVAVGALTVACAALAGYVIWLRGRVSRRMREVLSSR